ncbi:MAG TPA: topoisomerase DNA-binding C4 zinc finger domain-containing protein, partial [Longimicrobiaceae bacterium]|nr:topoisomerase DNA-binding C4 zinc finger domain-containing protein [Longimicrobiaceae bacterium]
IWGGTIEREFAVLSQDHKLEFLHLLARQASRSSAPSPVVPPTPSPGMLQIASNPVSGGGSGPPPQPVPLAPPACPECGGQMALRTNRRSGQRFWGCRRFPDCKGTMSM